MRPGWSKRVQIRKQYRPRCHIQEFRPRWTSTPIRSCFSEARGCANDGHGGRETGENRCCEECSHQLNWNVIVIKGTAKLLKTGGPERDRTAGLLVANYETP